MFRLYMIALAFFLFSFHVFSQSYSDKYKITTKDLGKFLITTHDSIEVNVKVDQLQYFDSIHKDFPNSDICVKIAKQDNQPVSFINLCPDSYQIIYIQSVNLVGIGKALIVVFELTGVCYGRVCEKLQIYGFNELGYFAPFTGIIDVGMDFNAKSFNK